jgi:hypothetical protein
MSREVQRVTRKTESELLFEGFCNQHRLDWEPIPTGSGKTPDYRLRFNDRTVLVEVEQIESQAGFNPGGVSSRTVGSHVRRKISEARRQLKAASEAGLPAILLIHNTVDPWQAFGTEEHDFVCAMYGELTVRLVNRRSSGSFHGRNAKLRRDANVSFSGVGHLKRVADGAVVKVFENVYAAHSLPFDVLPPCIEVVRVEVEHAA